MGRLTASILQPLARAVALFLAAVVAQLQLDSPVVIKSVPEATQIDRAAFNGTKPPQPQTLRQLS